MVEQYDIIIVPLSEDDGGGYAGYVPDLPGCMSDGETRVEAISNTENAIEEWISLQEKRNLPVPKPGAFTEFVNKKNHEIAEKIERFISSLGSRVDALESEFSSIREAIKNLEQKDRFEDIICFEGKREGTFLPPAHKCLN